MGIHWVLLFYLTIFFYLFHLPYVLFSFFSWLTLYWIAFIILPSLSLLAWLHFYYFWVVINEHLNSWRVIFSGYKSLFTIYFFQYFEDVAPSSFTFYYHCWEVIHQIVTPLKIVLFLWLLLRLYVFNPFLFLICFFLIATSISSNPVSASLSWS